MPDKQKKIKGDDPNLTKRKRGRGERAIQIDGSQWGWKVGRTNVLINRLDGSRSVTQRTEFSWDNTPIGVTVDVTLPGAIEKYIRAHLINA